MATWEKLELGFSWEGGDFPGIAGAMHCRHVQEQIDTRKNILKLLLLLLLCKLPKSPVPLKPAGVEGILDLGGLGFQDDSIQV